MKSLDLAVLLRARFPGVAVRHDLGAADASLGAIVDVFGVPDGSARLFAAFVYGELAERAEREGISLPIVVPHSVAETKAHYPELYERLAFDSWAVSAQQIAESRARSVWRAPPGEAWTGPTLNAAGADPAGARSLAKAA